MKHTDLKYKSIYVIITLSILLSLIQFAYNRSIWLDEAMLALNIIDKSFHELLQPLNDIQVAPILFLYLEKITALIIPNSEYGLRIIPLLCFWGALVLFHKILQIRFRANPFLIPALLGLFAFNATLIYYSSEVKQYMGDVFVLTGMYYLSLRYYTSQKQQYLLLGVFGVVSIFLSHVAPFILLSSLIYLIYKNLPKPKWGPILALSLIWLIFYSAYYYVFVHDHPSKSPQVNNWSTLGVFIPLNPLKPEFYEFCFHNGKVVFSKLLNFGWPGKILLPLIFGLGSLALIQKRDVGTFILSLPVFMHLLASALQLYPFSLRLYLYATPIVIIIIGLGLERSYQLISPNVNNRITTLTQVVIPLLLLVSFFSKPFPIRNEEIKESINFIGKNFDQGDQLYLFYGAQRAFQFYQSIEKVPFDGPILEGKNFRKNRQGYLNELIGLRGRYWLLFAHDNFDEEKFMIKRFEEKGVHQLKVFKARGSSAYLYNF